jgi:hypothetical protein
MSDSLPVAGDLLSANAQPQMSTVKSAYPHDQSHLCSASRSIGSSTTG